MPKQRRTVLTITVDEVNDAPYGDGFEVSVRTGGQWDWKVALIGHEDHRQIKQLYQALQRGLDLAKRELRDRGEKLQRRKT